MDEQGKLQRQDIVVVMPREEAVRDAIDYLVMVLREPENVPLEEAGRRVAAAVALLNAYSALKQYG